MACNRWETEGLLFTSGELDESTANSFSNHLEECEDCRSEFSFYSEGKESFFTIENLSEEPSPSIDEKILKQCANPIKPAFFIPNLGNFMKTGSLALLVLLLGVSAPVYFSAVKNSTNGTAVAANQTTIQETIEDTTNSKDSLNENGKIELKRGNLNVNGVIPVELTGN